jgi:hypothetical protein
MGIVRVWILRLFRSAFRNTSDDCMSLWFLGRALLSSAPATHLDHLGHHLSAVEGGGRFLGVRHLSYQVREGALRKNS